MFTSAAYPKKTLAALAAGSSLAGAALLFLHLMQSNAAFAEAVGRISPDIANQFGCSCPLCNRSAACSVPEAEMGVTRLDATNLNSLLGR